MNRIANAAAQTLENARMYLAKLPIADQNMTIVNIAWNESRIVNEAIPILFHAECGIRLENSQN